MGNVGVLSYMRMISCTLLFVIPRSTSSPGSNEPLKDVGPASFLQQKLNSKYVHDSAGDLLQILLGESAKLFEINPRRRQRPRTNITSGRD